MKRLLMLFTITAFLFWLAGCAAPTSGIPMSYRWANVDGSQLNESLAGEQFYFNIFVDDGMLAAGVPIKIKVSGTVNSGWLRFELRRPNGQVAWNSGQINPGDFSIDTAYPLPAGQAGTYTLGLVYGDDTSATYNLAWHALKLGPLVLLPGVGMLVIALGFILFAAFRKILDWRYLGLGALFWVLTVAVKFAFAIPVNPIVMRILGVSQDALFSPGNLVAYLYIGALTGIFEAGLAWLILRKIRWGKATWTQALVFGIGFGVIEAFLLGLASGGSALVGMLAPEALPVSTLGNLANNATLLMGLAPMVERFAVILAHIYACVLIFYAVASREAKWGWLAILYKTLLDAPAGFAAFWGAGSLEKIWTLEAMIAFFGLIGFLGTLQIARRYRNLQGEPGLGDD